jgi:hypothetical protein
MGEFIAIWRDGLRQSAESARLRGAPNATDQIVMNRRGVLADLLCSPLYPQTKKVRTTIIELDLTPNAVVLQVRGQGKIVKFTAGELMPALEPLVSLEAPDPDVPIPIQGVR